MGKMRQREKLFRVLLPASGQEWNVFTDGSVEGFPANVYVVNYHPALLAREKTVLRREVLGRSYDPLQRPEAQDNPLHQNTL